MKTGVLLLTIGLAVSVSASQATGTIISGPDIISAPASVNNETAYGSNPGGGASNTHQQGFNEKQNILLTANLSVDGGTIPTGTLVDSHMIFYNWVGSGPHSDGPWNWEFSGEILGVMSDIGGQKEVASSLLLGAPGTVYPLIPYQYRGIEGETGDWYSVVDDTLTLKVGGNAPGDWIRVITLAPEPMTLFVMMATGLPVLLRRRRNRS